MTAKEKAIELVDRFKIGDVVVEKRGTNQIVNINTYAKLFALRAVDEIINGYEFDSLDIEHKRIIDNINFWDEVKAEIKKL